MSVSPNEVRTRASRPRARQRGIAVITAMLIVALGTITMVAITSRQQLDLQRERNEALIQAARDLSASGERFASVLLYRDFKEALRDNSDSLDDDWAQTIPPIPIDNAAIQGCIVDLQGRFNLNNLVDAAGVAVPLYRAQLERLLAYLTIDVVKAQAIVDWIDTDVNPIIPEGAEDDFYTSLDPPYRAANAPFTSVSELQLVKGFDPRVEQELEDYELLLPYVSALPTADGPTAVNVNTAPPAVISSIADGYVILADTLSRWETPAYEDYPECEDIFDLTAEETTDPLGGDAPRTPFLTPADFDAAAGGALTDPAPPVDVKSTYFESRIDVIAEGLRLSQFTLFQRDGEGRTRIVRRTRDTL